MIDESEFEKLDCLVSSLGADGDLVVVVVALFWLPKDEPGSLRSNSLSSLLALESLAVRYTFAGPGILQQDNRSIVRLQQS